MPISRKTLPVSAAFAAIALTACTAIAQPSEQPVQKHTADMLTVVTSGDAETQLMALVLTNSAKAQGKSPRILLCGPGGDLALKEASESSTAPQQPKGVSPQGLLKKLMDDGVKVEVCAIFLPNRPFGSEALLDGIGAANPGDIGGAIAREGETILSF